MALKCETEMPPNGMVNVIDHESGCNPDDLEDGEIFDDDEDVPLPNITNSQPAVSTLPTAIAVEEKRNTSPIQKSLHSRPKRNKRSRDDERPFRSNKIRKHIDDNERREKHVSDEEYYKESSPIRAEWDQNNRALNTGHYKGLMDGEEDEMERPRHQTRDFGSGRSRIGMRPTRGVGSRRVVGRRENTQPCKFFMQGNCQKGLKCPYAHGFSSKYDQKYDQKHEKRYEACRYYMMECCRKKDQCPFLHSEFPCKYFFTGQKCFAGKKCRFSHEKITPQFRSLLLRDSKDCDFLLDKDESSRLRQDNNSSRSRERDREFRENHRNKEMRNSHKEREMRENDREQRNKDKYTINFKNNHKTTSSDEDVNRTPMPSPSRENSSDRDCKEIKSPVHNEKKNESSIRSPPINKDKEFGEETDNSGLASIPMAQRELYMRIKQQQERREADENLKSDDDNEKKEEDYKEDFQYSSEDEDYPLTSVLNTVKQKQIDHQNQIAAGPSTSTIVPQQPIIPTNIYSDIDVDVVSRLLSTVRETIQQRTGNQISQNQLIYSTSTVPLSPTSTEVMSPPVEKRRVRDPRLRGNVIEDDIDLRMGLKGDIDLRQLPFKAAPPHTPATEIDASINSHPPVEYKLTPYAFFVKPDYSKANSLSTYDPRINKNIDYDSIVVYPTTCSTLVPQAVPDANKHKPAPSRPIVEIRDPRQRAILANDPRRKSSVLLHRDSDLRHPPQQQFPQIGDVDLRMHPHTAPLPYN